MCSHMDQRFRAPGTSWRERPRVQRGGDQAAALAPVPGVVSERRGIGARSARLVAEVMGRPAEEIRRVRSGRGNRLESYGSLYAARTHHWSERNREQGQPVIPAAPAQLRCGVPRTGSTDTVDLSVAQRKEQRFKEPWVAGSIPV